jgi:hypothetical protein
MIVPVIRFLLAGAWKPIAWALGALGLYAKGRSDAKAKAKQQQAEAKVKTIEEVLRETPSDDPADAIRQRMSDRARKP